MKKTVIIYFDGGAYKNSRENKDECLLSYGILMHSGNEDPIESYGEYHAHMMNSGRHEYLAFVESYKIIKQYNINFKDVYFYTDCYDLAFSNMYLHKENYNSTQKRKLLENIYKIAQMLKMTDHYEDIIQCLEEAQFNKIKAHDSTIDNIRVDYLSKMAHKNEVPLCYKKFLECAFKKYTENGLEITNLPFMPDNQTNKIKIQ